MSSALLPSFSDGASIRHGRCANSRRRNCRRLYAAHARHGGKRGSGAGLQWDPPPAALREPLDMRPALGNVMLLEAEGGSDDDRHRLYGARIAKRSGFDLTDKRTRDTKTHPVIGLLYRVLYGAVTVRRAALFLPHVPRATYPAMARRTD